MVDVTSFEEEMSLLKKIFEFGSYEYINIQNSFRSITVSHFGGVKRRQKYGVYVVRRKDTEEVLYVGKGGTLDSQGRFKEQDVPKRLVNVKESKILADKWFRNLLREEGPLIVEYIFLPSLKSPALVEAALLQAFLNEHNRLPRKNKSL